MMAKVMFEEVVWPAKPMLPDPVQWKRAKHMVRMLLAIGEVDTWLHGKRGGPDTYTHMPYHYTVDGVGIIFLPHWGRMYVGRSVGKVELPVMTTRRDLLRAVRAIKIIQELQAKYRK